MLIANERKDRLALVAPIVAALGHEVIPREIEVEDVGAVTARERPDVALVGLGESSEHALQMVEKIVPRPPARLKHDYGLTPLRVRGLDRVALHADLTMLARLCVVLARTRAGPLAA